MEEVFIINYTAGDPNTYNRQNRKALKKDLEKITSLAKIDKAAEAAFKFVEKDKIPYSTAFGFFKAEFEKECIRLNKWNRFRYFELNLNFMNEKYGKDGDQARSYEENSIGVVGRIRNFANRFK